jgi:hypothetical protein
MVLSDYHFQLAMIAFNRVIPILNLPVIYIRRASSFAFEQSKHPPTDGRFVDVDEAGGLPFSLLRIFPKTRYVALLFRRGER